MKRFLFQISVFTFGFLFQLAQAQEDRIADRMTEGWRSTASVDDVRAPGGMKSELRWINPKNTAQFPGLAAVQSDLDKQFTMPGTRAAILSDKRTVIFEKYLSPKVTERSTPIGNSMSKSLVGLAVGKALCDGSIKSLNDSLGGYVKALADTSWGRASIHDVLRMSSGAFRANPADPSGFKSQQDQNENRAIYAGQLSKDYIAMMREVDERSASPGTEFNYSNYDTQALVLLVEAATREKFSTYFEKKIWKDVGAEADGAWIRNNKGQVAGYVGFSATTRDWLRLGHYVLDELKKNGCFSDFLKKATAQQIAANWTYQKSYGYQIWANCTHKRGSFCFLGFGGQQLIMHPGSQTVLYVHATANHVVAEWRSIFERYQ